jgi:threonine aldolase
VITGPRSSELGKATVLTEKTIDLRSDTVTQPTEAMRRAMAEAPVGDDVYGEDPTVNRLEAMTADLLGKEAAVFVSSGTMGNLASVLTHCGRGDEMIVGDQAHVFMSEQGGAAALGGVQPRTAPTSTDGTLDLATVEDMIRPDNEHYPRTRLLTIENTHNRSGGRALPVDYMDAAGALARRRGLKLHVDGARLWNAAVALNVAPARLLQEVDSASLCLSKGLGAPIGSLVVGDAEFIRRARRMRKILGGGTRQAGVIAAAGIVAITEMIERLADDHANARKLAEGLAEIGGIVIDPAAVETDIVIFGLRRDDLTPAQLSAGLKELGVLLHPIDSAYLRAVTNLHVTSADIERTLDAFARVLDPAGRGAESV